VNHIKDALKRVDMLTQEEARMATAEVLKVIHRVDGSKYHQEIRTLIISVG